MENQESNQENRKPGMVDCISNSVLTIEKNKWMLPVNCYNNPFGSKNKDEWNEKFYTHNFNSVFTNDKGKYNFTYQKTDSLFIITVHPRKGIQK